MECYQKVKGYGEKDSKEIALKFLRMQMNETKRAFLEMFRDEIFATAKSHGISHLLVRYLPFARERSRYFPSKMMRELRDKLQNDEEAMNIINEHSKEKYHDYVEEAARIFANLVRENHYTERQVASLLADIPIWRWKRMVRRWKDIKDGKRANIK